MPSCIGLLGALMKNNQMIALSVKLKSGDDTTMFLGAGNFAISEHKDPISTKLPAVYLMDGVHNNGGYQLHSSETFKGVTERINSSVAGSGVFALPVSLKSGGNTTLYLGGGNFAVTALSEKLINRDPVVCIDDGVHNNGGWHLSSRETLKSVSDRIANALKDSPVISLEVTLKSGSKAVLYLGAGNFNVTGNKHGFGTNPNVSISDGVHNNGGWTLHKDETYAAVTARIEKAMIDKGLLPPKVAKRSVMERAAEAAAFVSESKVNAKKLAYS